METRSTRFWKTFDKRYFLDQMSNIQIDYTSLIDRFNINDKQTLFYFQHLLLLFFIVSYHLSYQYFFLFYFYFSLYVK